MVEPMPPTPDGGDTPTVPPLPPFLVPPGYSNGTSREWNPSPARPVSVAPMRSAPLPSLSATPPLPALPAAPPVPVIAAAPVAPPLPAYTPTTSTAVEAEPARDVDPERDTYSEADSAMWGPAPAPVEEPRSWLKVLWPWGVRGVLESVEVLLLALVMFAFVRSMGQNFVVDGGSMEPTFHNGEMLIVNKIVYRSFDVSWLPWSDNSDWRPFGSPEPGDVVVFQFPQNPSRDFIKRVIAVAGQTVEVRGGNLFVDGVLHPEPFLSQPPAYDYGPATVPPGQYFVLGDNRNNSYDSHAWGMLDHAFMIGRAEFRYWPPDRAGRVGNDDPSPTPQAGVLRSQ